MIKIDQIIRSKRRTIGLHITPEAHLIVRAPFRVSEEYIQKIVQQKTSWIIQKQESLRARLKLHQPKKFIPGEEFLFLGKVYTLTINHDLTKAVLLNENLMVSDMILSNLKDHLEHWYKSQALEYMIQRVQYFADITELKYQTIKVSDASTRWGSCGYQDTLNFNWRLIMAPSRVVDYVVVHELMHIKQKNHSRKFWMEVANIIPDYKIDEKWLKENGHSLKW